MPQWLQAQASAIWVLHRWQSFKKRQRDSFASAHHCAANHALQLRATDPEHAH